MTEVTLGERVESLQSERNEGREKSGRLKRTLCVPQRSKSPQMGAAATLDKNSKQKGGNIIFNYFTEVMSS